MFSQGKLIGRRTISFVSAAAALTLVGYGARAEIVYNFGGTVDPKMSKEASSQLTAAIAQVAYTISVAESASQPADREKANLQLQSALEQLRISKKLFAEIKKRIGKVPIDMNKATMSKQELDRRASRFKVQIPQNTEMLADLTISEIDGFLQSTSDISFGNVQKARAAAVSIGEAINRLYQIGTMVSALADGAEQAKQR
jgi:hypothetical protein